MRLSLHLGAGLRRLDAHTLLDRMGRDHVHAQRAAVVLLQPPQQAEGVKGVSAGDAAHQIERPKVLQADAALRVLPELLLAIDGRGAARVEGDRRVAHHA